MMKKLFLLLIILVFPNVLFSSVDECKTDVYFANGILTTPRQASDNAILLDETIKQNIYVGNLQKYNKQIGKVDYAYNSTDTATRDMYEAYLQLKAEGGISVFQEFLLKHFPLAEYLVDEDIKKVLDEEVNEKIIKKAHDVDLDKQIKKYRTSINNGHSVAVVAHSQGALFTNEAYAALTKADTDDWHKKFFRAFFVAPASTKVLEDDVKTPSFVFHNDIITNLSDKFYFNKTTNSNLFEEKVRTSYPGEYKYISQKDKIFHSFQYYMGETIFYTDGRGDHSVSTNLAKDEIAEFIGKSVVTHGLEDSQWIKDKEFGKDTCDYKITVKNQYDPSLDIGERVYPFNVDGKLYQVNGEYVKASCGGDNILEAWDGKQDNECLMIDNPEEEKIIIKNTGRLYRIEAAPIWVRGSCNSGSPAKGYIYITDNSRGSYAEIWDILLGGGGRIRDFVSPDHYKTYNVNTEGYNTCSSDLVAAVTSIINGYLPIIDSEVERALNYINNMNPSGNAELQPYNIVCEKTGRYMKGYQCQLIQIR